MDPKLKRLPSNLYSINFLNMIKTNSPYSSAAKAFGINAVPKFGINVVPKFGINAVPKLGINAVPKFGINALPKFCINTGPKFPDRELTLR